MSVGFHVAMPFVVLTALVLWVAGGLWCERNLGICRESYIWSAIGVVASMIWFLVMIGGVLLFGGSLVGLFFRLFLEGKP